MDTPIYFPANSSLNISSEYNECSENVMSIITDIASGVALLTSLFVIYLIFYKSPPMMSTYKKYLFANMFFQMLNTVTFSLGKPRILYTTNVVFTAGLLPFQQRIVTILAYGLWHSTMISSLTCISLIHIERYYTIHEGIMKKNSCLNLKFFICFYIILNILLNLGMSISGLYGDIFIQETITYTRLTEMFGGKEFLSKYAGAVLLNDKKTISMLIYYASLIVAAASTLFPLFIFLSLNVFTGFKTIQSKDYSTKTKKLHITLLRTSIVQALVLLLCVTLPAIFFIVALFIRQIIIGVDYIQFLFILYPIADNIVVLFCIKPYRDFIFSCLQKNSVSDYSKTT